MPKSISEIMGGPTRRTPEEIRRSLFPGAVVTPRVINENELFTQNPINMFSPVNNPAPMVFGEMLVEGVGSDQLNIGTNDLTGGFNIKNHPIRNAGEKEHLRKQIQDDAGNVNMADARRNLLESIPETSTPPLIKVKQRKSGNYTATELKELGLDKE